MEVTSFTVLQWELSVQLLEELISSTETANSERLLKCFINSIYKQLRFQKLN